MSPYHILLVSGPSGGGKSTFIRQFITKTLEAKITSLMPPSADTWPIIEANNALKKNAPRLCHLPPPPCDTLLHYDIVFIHRYGIGRYEDDPALDLLRNATSLHIVFIRPDHQALHQQFFARQTKHKQAKSNISLLWGRFVRVPLRHALAPLTGKAKLSTEELYRKKQWISECYRQWEDFIQTLSQRPNTRVSILEPNHENPNTETFRLLSDSATSAPPPPHEQ